MADQKALSLDELLEQEQRYEFSSFDNDDALRLGAALVDAARDRGLPVTIDICRGGQQLFHAALPGTASDNDDWLRRKGRVVERFGHSSYYVGRSYTDRGERFEDEPHWDMRTHAAHGGAFPVRVRGVGIVGVVAVSGLPQDQDHELVVTVLEEFLGSAAR